MRRVVVVGASLAGLHTAQALRRHGHTGELVVLGEEPHMPYDRPPLSKQLLDGTLTRSQLDLPVDPGLDATWLLGRRAVGLDVDRREVHLADGTAVPYDGLVVATGSRARGWPTAAPPGVLTVRTVEDAQGLSRAMDGAGSVLVIGAGFLGGEVAAAARRRGLRVVLVEPQAVPLLAAAGPVVGAFVAELHRVAGIDLRLSTAVTSLATGPDGRLSGAELSDGTHVAADLAVAALGAVPNTEWLDGSGLQLDRGLVVDEHCRPRLPDGTPADGIVAAGDVTRWPHPLSAELLSTGHWTHAVEQADVAARNLLRPGAAPPYRPVPSFWSDLHGTAVRSVGLPHLADTADIREHDAPARRLVAAYSSAGRLVGALTVNRTSRLGALRAGVVEQLGTGPEPAGPPPDRTGRALDSSGAAVRA